MCCGGVHHLQQKYVLHCYSLTEIRLSQNREIRKCLLVTTFPLLLSDNDTRLLVSLEAANWFS